MTEWLARRWLHALSGLPGLLLAAWAWAAHAAPANEPPAVHYTQAELAVTPRPDGSNMAETLAIVQALTPPDAASAAWMTVPLPDATPRKVVSTDAHVGAALMRWYRLRYAVAGASPTTPLGLYIPRVNAGPLQVMLRTGAAWQVLYRSNDRWREEWNRPVLVELPADAAAIAGLGPGKDGQLELLIGSSGADGDPHTLSTVWIGPLDALRWRHDWRSLLQLQAPMATSTAILIVGLFAGGVWWRRRHEEAYLYFALAAVVWSFRNLHYYIDLPRGELAWSWFWWATHASLSWVMLLVYRFALRFDGRRHRRLERWLLGGVVLATLINLPLWPHVRDALILQHLIDAAVALSVTGYMSLLSWRGGGPELRTITLASWVGQLFGVNDLLLLAGRISPESIYLLPYAPLVVFASFLYATLRRYVQAIEQVEGANSLLEASLRQREAELEANHARLRSIEREQALLLERERLMADMHDGIGSTLMSSLIMLEQGHMSADGAAAVVRECVDDLRLVIDSLEPIDNDLSTLLATLRYRLGRRMEAAGVRLEWAMDDLPPLPWLTPPDALQVLRLLQEVLTNVLKHAKARSVLMAARLTPAHEVEVRIQDDGCGFDMKAAIDHGGRGMSNLRLRTRQLRARLEVDSAPGHGTTVRLLLPVQRATA